MKTLVAIASFFAVAASAHGNITSPPARVAGSAMAQLCGANAVAAVEADGTISVEDLGTVGADCNAFLCRGAQFEDNANNVQQLAVGDVVQFKAILRIPHVGTMNVSIIDTATNTVIGKPLISFDRYADEALAQLPANNTAFSVTVPQVAGDACKVAGQCVMQWFWFGEKAVQTYESCVDFVLA